MRYVSGVVALLVMLVLSGCASKFQSYDGPEVTHVLVMKGERRMHLLHHDAVLESYDIGLGFAPQGHKMIEGDGRTPEGQYLIDRRNPSSEFHLSIGISYPNNVDREIAKTLGKSPGGDIFIHGKPRKYRRASPDWTAGCIAVTNRQMEKIYAMVQDGTPITIQP
jgi:murein L,D-transpeptidase YafK